MVVRYDQDGSERAPTSFKPNTRIFHVPIARWRDHPPRPTDPLRQLHGLIPMRLWHHATEVLNIG